jgi:hypothetical protein
MDACEFNQPAGTDKDDFVQLGAPGGQIRSATQERGERSLARATIFGLKVSIVAAPLFERS